MNDSEEDMYLKVVWVSSLNGSSTQTALTGQVLERKCTKICINREQQEMSRNIEI